MACPHRQGEKYMSVETKKVERGLARHRALRVLLDRIDSTPYPDRLWSLLREFARDRGFDRIVVIDVARLGVGGQRALVHANPDTLGKAIVEAYRVADAQAIREALSQPEPYLFSDLFPAEKRAGTGWVQAVAAGMRNSQALIVPIHDDEGRPVAAAIFAGVNVDTCAVARAELYVAAHAVYNRYLASIEQSTSALGRTLSRREIDCLRLASVGKSDEEIGETLAISARTVRFHVDAAKTKLGANNRVTAVAMALREKLIALLAAFALGSTAAAASPSPAVNFLQYVC
jgi:DNA-binding CsgD family transcriptional regulator